MTPQIKNSHKKRELYIKYRDSSDTNFKLYYKGYCKVLTEVIITAK